MLSTFAVAVSLATSVAVARAQERPDFSGRWTNEPEQSAVPGRGGGAGGGRGGRGDMGSGWGNTITVAQDAAKLTVEYTFFGRGDMQPPLKFTYALDGAESKNTVMMGWGIQSETSRASWNGASLVITTTHTFPHPDTGRPTPMDVVRTLSLDAGSLVVHVSRAGVLGGPATSTRTVYRKLPSQRP